MAKKQASTAISGEPLSQAEIEAFVADWYHKLDLHARAEELLPLVSEQCGNQVKEECLKCISRKEVSMALRNSGALV
jgi:hypothetical protein